MTSVKHAVVVALAWGVGLAAMPANAVTIVNGSMTDTGGNYSTFNMLVPAGWTSLPFVSPDIFDENSSFSGFTWNASTDGGTFVHALAHANTFSSEGVFQDITGLSIGESYEVAFEQSISFTTAALQGSGGYFDVTFGTETLPSAFMANPGSGVGFAWQTQSLTFTATAATQTLTFEAFVDPNEIGRRVDLGLDGVSVSVIPEPSSAVLVGLGLAALAVVRRRS